MEAFSKVEPRSAASGGLGSSALWPVPYVQDLRKDYSPRGPQLWEGQVCCLPGAKLNRLIAGKESALHPPKGS